MKVLEIEPRDPIVFKQAHYSQVVYFYQDYCSLFIVKKLTKLSKRN